MKTPIAIAAMTILFLSAGAFAANNQPVSVPAKTTNANVTVISKNQSWPVKGLITVESCKTVGCIAV